MHYTHYMHYCGHYMHYCGHYMHYCGHYMHYCALYMHYALYTYYPCHLSAGTVVYYSPRYLFVICTLRVRVSILC